MPYSIPQGTFRRVRRWHNFWLEVKYGERLKLLGRFLCLLNIHGWRSYLDDVEVCAKCWKLRRE